MPRSGDSFVVDGSKLILSPDSTAQTVLDMDRYDRVLIVGGGKATAPMAKAIEDLLEGRIRAGIINVKYGFTQPLRFTRIVEAGHPIPDQNGVDGAKAVLDLLAEAGERDLVFSLISGGGSALLPQPIAPITLAEKQAMTRKMLACGASIDEINALRKHISSSKGGQMAKAAHPATVVNLMLSDVVGDKMDVIASGPFVPDRSTFEDVIQVFKKYELKDIPETVRVTSPPALARRVPETPKPGDAVFRSVHNFVVGSNILALEAAVERAKALGYQTLILSSMVEGENP